MNLQTILNATTDATSAAEAARHAARLNAPAPRIYRQAEMNAAFGLALMEHRDPSHTLRTEIWSPGEIRGLELTANQTKKDMTGGYVIRHQNLGSPNDTHGEGRETIYQTLPDAFLKAGLWGEGKAVISKVYYPSKDFSELTETLQGQRVTVKLARPEFLSRGMLFDKEQHTIQSIPGYMMNNAAPPPITAVLTNPLLRRQPAFSTSMAKATPSSWNM